MCMDFQTHVCQLCSGVHREFGHKVRSIALSAWSPAELQALRQGGNERAAKRWLALAGAGERDARSAAAVNGTSGLDVDMVRDYVRSKYKKKAWFREDATQCEPLDVAESARPVCVAAVTKAVTPPVGDLLSDDLAGGACFPCLAAPPPVPRVLAPRSVGASSGSTSDWVADFSRFPDFADPALEVASQGACQAVHTESLEIATAVATAAAPWCTSRNVVLLSGEQTTEEEKEEEKEGRQQWQPSPAQGPPTSSKVGSGAWVGGGEGNIVVGAKTASWGDQLRQIVLAGGKSEDMRDFYQQITAPQRARPADFESRLKAYSAFDEIDSAEAAVSESSPATPSGGQEGMEKQAPPVSFPSAPQVPPQAASLQDAAAVVQSTPQLSISTDVPLLTSPLPRGQVGCSLAPDPRSSATRCPILLGRTRQQDVTHALSKDFDDLLAVFQEKDLIPALGK